MYVPGFPLRYICETGVLAVGSENFVPIVAFLKMLFQRDYFLRTAFIDIGKTSVFVRKLKNASKRLYKEPTNNTAWITLSRQLRKRRLSVMRLLLCLLFWTCSTIVLSTRICTMRSWCERNSEMVYQDKLSVIDEKTMDTPGVLTTALCSRHALYNRR